MAKSMRKVLAILGALVMVVVLAGIIPGSSSAANLTGGNYTYVINGEETVFSYDPVIRKDGLLLPIEVFQNLGINVDGTLGKTITLTKGTDVTAILTVGTTTASVNNAPYLVDTAPLRLNGRVFLPSDILTQFGVDVSQDASFVVLRDYAAGVTPAKTYTDSDWNTLKTPHTVSAQLKSDSSIFISGEFTYLTPDLINSTNLGLTYGTRVRLLTLLQTNTLIYAKFTNPYTKSGAVPIGGLYLIDGNGVQYDTPTAMDIGQGLITNKLAPTASRVGVLVFPKVQTQGTTLQFYYDSNGANLGVFSTLN